MTGQERGPADAGSIRSGQPPSLAIEPTCPRCDLPTGWTVELRCVLNVVVLRLRDEDGREREAGFRSCDPRLQAGLPSSARSLNEIPDTALRAAAAGLLRTHRLRAAAAQAAVDRFTAAHPDLDLLADALHRAGVGVALDLDADALALTMTLTAAPPALVTLVFALCSWNEQAALPERSPDGTHTARLDQDSAASFLKWLRGNTAALRPHAMERPGPEQASSRPSAAATSPRRAPRPGNGSA